MNIRSFLYRIKNHINLYRYKVNQELFKLIYPDIKFGTYDSVHYFCHLFLKKLKNRRMLYEFFPDIKLFDRKNHFFLQCGITTIGIGLLLLYSIFVYTYFQNIKFSTTLIILILGVLIFSIYLKTERLLIRMFLSSILLNNSVETRQSIYQNFLLNIASNDALNEKDYIYKTIDYKKNIKNEIKKRL